MTRHANAEVRCEQQEARPLGISQKSLKLISSQWGATWGNIYEILFPGATVPDNPCVSPNTSGQSDIADESTDVETMQCSLCDHDSVSIENRLLQDLNAFSQAKFEHRARAMLDDEMAPMEEELKKRFVDMISRCQIDHLAEFQQSKKLSSLASDPANTSADSLASGSTSANLPSGSATVSN